ncbi:MAG: iron transporter [Clostridia bacterium]|nr:iron transporter [Clostridia bacterium]
MTKKLLGMALVAAMAISLVGCNSAANDTGSADNGTSTAASEAVETNEATSAEVKSDAAAAAPDEAAGFTEIPIFEDETAGFLSVNAVYFQPVPMSNGNESIEDFDLHLEADISALENDLGFGVGDWVPYLTVDYAVTDSKGKEAASGTFMEMSASDGPHYGANIKLPDADTYSIKFTIHSPEENGYLLHVDEETGPGGSFDEYFKDGNLEVNYEGWEYTPQEW